MTATPCQLNNPANNSQVLYLAFELGWSEWKLAFTTGFGQAARLRSLGARNLAGLQEEIAAAKKRFGLPADAPVCSCYEAGRDGFWLHRSLTQHGIDNVIVVRVGLHRPPLGRWGSSGPRFLRIACGRMQYRVTGPERLARIEGCCGFPQHGQKPPDVDAAKKATHRG